MRIARTLIANRGEIAVRVIHACQELGIETVLAVSSADRDSLAASLADRVVCIGPARSGESYLNHRAITAAALGTGADSVHPGYGFLAESPTLADACTEAGLTFIGPAGDTMRTMGNKIAARTVARSVGVPTLPGSERVDSPARAGQIAAEVGYPVMMKAAAGGGGRGMKIVPDASAMTAAFDLASAEAAAAFGDGTLYLEQFVRNARHIEVQVLGDKHGNVVHLGERDCSLQRRHQKLVEEAPAPGITEELRESIRAAAVELATATGYEGAGTVEFIYDADRGTYYFLEMNTRIQVEHPVSEMITGIDIVQEQFRAADGQRLRYTQADVQFRGHAIECRVTAEIAEQGFRPNAGRIGAWQPPAGPNVRVDTHCFAGYEVPVYYDSLLAKLIVYGSTRAEAISRMRAGLARFHVEGVQTSIPFLRFVTSRDEFAGGAVSTGLIDRLLPEFRRPAGPTHSRPTPTG